MKAFRIGENTTGQTENNHTQGWHTPKLCQKYTKKGLIFLVI